jgi:hypothetical protein
LELVGRIPDQEIFRRLVLEATEIAIKNTNERLKLNVTLGYSGQFGKKYLDIH